MEGHFVEEGRAECLQAPKAHLSSLPSWRWKSSPQTPTTPDEIPLRAVAGGKAGHPRQSRKENGWNRWGKPFLFTWGNNTAWQKNIVTRRSPSARSDWRHANPPHKGDTSWVKTWEPFGRPSTAPSASKAGPSG